MERLVSVDSGEHRSATDRNATPCPEWPRLFDNATTRPCKVLTGCGNKDSGDDARRSFRPLPPTTPVQLSGHQWP